MESSHRGICLRSPICSIVGHVDAGKTKLLECMGMTEDQGYKAGGKCCAAYFPAKDIRKRIRQLTAFVELSVPGILVIETPLPECSANLRHGVLGLCDVAILVVDIMRGVDSCTIESIKLLKMRNTQFIVALNKVDKLYGWKSCAYEPIGKAMTQQWKSVRVEFRMRLNQVVTQLKAQGVNTKLCYKNVEMGETISIVPTSPNSGEGIPDLLLELVKWAQRTPIEKLTFRGSVQCIILEVKEIQSRSGTLIEVACFA